MTDYIICSGFRATIYCCIDINIFLPCEIVSTIVLMIDPIILSWGKLQWLYRIIFVDNPRWTQAYHGIDDRSKKPQECWSRSPSVLLEADQGDQRRVMTRRLGVPTLEDIAGLTLRRFVILVARERSLILHWRHSNSDIWRTTAGL